MILLQFFLIFAIFLPVLTAPNLAGALAKISEARARALTNRVKIRQNSAKLMAQLTPNRFKRQEFPNHQHLELEKEAEATHSHSHTHFHHLSHHHGGHHKVPFVPAQGVNVNINQNQGFSAQTLPQNQFFPQHYDQVLPQHQDFVLPQHHSQILPQHQNQFITQHQSQIVPQSSHHGSSITQTQSVFRNRDSAKTDFENFNEMFDPSIQKIEMTEFLSNHQLPPVFGTDLRKSDFQSQPEQHYSPILTKINHELSEPRVLLEDFKILASPHLIDVPQYRDYYNYLHPKMGLGEVGRVRRSREILKNFSKRSIPLMRLVSDPNMKLDVPKTIENFGTVTKNAFEDERAPLYHLKHLLGSSRNTVLSAMKIPPQNLVIPSDYEIVRSRDKNERVGAINPSITSRNRDDTSEKSDASAEFGNTFRRVGQIIRESIKSGQDTATHVGDIAHDARNILHTAKFSAPRLITPFSQIPALQNGRRNSLSPAMLITPRIIDVAEERLGTKQKSRPNLVKLGEIMDAVGVSNPNSPEVDLRKIILKPNERSGKLTKIIEKLKQDNDANVGETLHTLENAKISVGAKNLRDFLVKMKNEFASALGNHRYDLKSKKHKSKKKKQEEEVTKFVETLFNDSKNKENLFAGRLQERNHEMGVSRSEMEEYVKSHCNPFLSTRSGIDETNLKSTEKNEENVGLYLPMELLKPFMGRASKSELKAFFQANGVNNPKLLGIDENSVVGNTNKFTNLDEKALGEILENLKQRNATQEETNNSENSVLGSINPLMFERMYHEPLRVNNNTVEDPQKLFARTLQESTHLSSNQTVGTGMTMHGPMLKPFMGKVQPDALEEFLDTYNQDSTGYEEIQIQ